VKSQGTPGRAAPREKLKNAIYLARSAARAGTQQRRQTATGSPSPRFPSLRLASSCAPSRAKKPFGGRGAPGERFHLPAIVPYTPFLVYTGKRVAALHLNLLAGHLYRPTDCIGVSTIITGNPALKCGHLSAFRR